MRCDVVAQGIVNAAKEVRHICDLWWLAYVPCCLLCQLPVGLVKGVMSRRLFTALIVDTSAKFAVCRAWRHVVYGARM